MDNKTNTRNKTKDVFISFLAGIGVLIITFLPSTILFQLLGCSLVVVSCSDVIGFSPNVGGLIGIVAGIVVGRITYKQRKGESVIHPNIVWIIIAFIVIAFILSLPILFLN